MTSEVQEQILKKIGNKISDLYISGHLRPGANKIYTRMNGIEATITVYIKDAVPLTFNMWVTEQPNHINKETK